MAMREEFVTCIAVSSQSMCNAAFFEHFADPLGLVGAAQVLRCACELCIIGMPQERHRN